MTKGTIKTIDDVELATCYTVGLYRTHEGNQDRENIADFVYRRFTERYLAPVSRENRNNHGFSIMAISCLMIEALESFYRGWPDSDRKSELAFCYFFQRNGKFNEFSQCCESFYKGVRCGILHQAETTNGWRILKIGNLLDIQNKTINASKFHETLERALQNYRKELKTTPWEEKVWINFRKKMKAIIANCR